MGADAKGAPAGALADITHGRGVALTVVAWVAFGAVHTLPRLGGGSQLGAADGLSMVAAQSLQLAYQVGQPPLYDWSVWLVQQVTGPTAFGVYLPKYLYCLVAGIYAYLGAREVTGHALLGVIASLSLMLLFNVGMTIHDLSTHSVPLLAAIAGTFYHFIRTMRNGGLGHYAGLGLAIAAGLLAKYGFLIWPVALIAAALLTPAKRSKILDPRFLVSLAIPIVLVLPFAAWVFANKDAFAERATGTLIGQESRGHVIRALDGLKDMVGSYLVYASPAIPILWLCWPKLLRRRLGRDELTAGTPRALLALALLIAAGVMAAGIALAGVDTMRSRYMHAVALLLPVFVASLIPPEELTRRRIGLFVMLLVAVHGVTSASRALIPVFPVRPFCRSCDVLQPVEKLADALAARGYGRGVLIVGDHQLAGNLRRHLPDAWIKTGKLLQTPPADQGRACAEVSEVKGGSRAPKPSGGFEIAIDWNSGLVGPKRRTIWYVIDRPSNHLQCSSGADL